MCADLWNGALFGVCCCGRSSPCFRVFRGLTCGSVFWSRSLDELWGSRIFHGAGPGCVPGTIRALALGNRIVFSHGPGRCSHWGCDTSPVQSSRGLRLLLLYHNGRIELIALHGSSVLSLRGNCADVAALNEGFKSFFQGLHGTEGRLPFQKLIAVSGGENAPAFAGDKAKDLPCCFFRRVLTHKPEGCLRVLEEEIPEGQGLRHLFGRYGAIILGVCAGNEVEEGGNPSHNLAREPYCPLLHGGIKTLTAPFGLVFATMFSPEVGKFVMALMALACAGCLTSWQFTIAEVFRVSAREGYFPKIFAKVSALNVPIIGIVIILLLQSLAALLTIDPRLEQQFYILKDLAVVTNLVPYLLAFAAVNVILHREPVEPKIVQRTTIIASFASAYSLYALYACGPNAMMWGALATFVGIWLYGYAAKSLEKKGKLLGNE